jgi:hypothetical protein
MPCSDSSSSISIQLDHDEKFLSYQYAKITCGREIGGERKYAEYLKGRTLPEIMAVTWQQAVTAMEPAGEEETFLLYLEWDALRSAVGLYLGVDDEEIDPGRCIISSIEKTGRGIEIVEIILPPKDLPKILPCGPRP